MKIYSLTAVLVLILLTACGSDNSDSGQVVHPVDAWSPFVQVLPPGNLWDVREGEQNSPTPSLPEPHRTRIELMSIEFTRIYVFLTPGPTMGGWFPEFQYPDFWGGLGFHDLHEYVIVYLVESKEDEAYEFLAYIEDFETVEIRFTPHSFNELLHVQRQIWDSGVYPVLWWTFINQSPSRITVQLFNYSEEEKRFFRQFVSDSPLIDFECFFDSHDEQVMRIPFWRDPSPPLNQLETVTMTAQIQNTHDFRFSVHNYFGLENLYLRNYTLEAYMNGRWIPVYHSFPIFPVIEQGINRFSFSTAHFARQIEGPFRINVILELTCVLLGFHVQHLTYIF